MGQTEAQRGVPSQVGVAQKAGVAVAVAAQVAGERPLEDAEGVRRPDRLAAEVDQIGARLGGQACGKALAEAVAVEKA